VIQIVAAVTGFADQIHPADDIIDDLGGTSLGIVRILVELQRYSGKRLRINDALADTSVAGLARLLREEAIPPLADFAFNTDGDAPPLFMIHAYLGGMLRLRRLAELLPPSQPVYGLQVYSGTEHYSGELTVSSLAENAAQRIRKIQPPERFVILGQSAGGLIAFEAARKMIEAGGTEPRVLLLDTPRPFAFGYDCGEWVMYWRDNLRNPARVLRALRTRLSRVVGPKQGRPQSGPQPDDLMVLNEKNLESIKIALRHYKAQSYNGNITIMRTGQGRIMALGRRTLGWASITRGALRVLDVPGQHLTMLDAPHLQPVAEKLIDWLSSE
jgi:thioesterase domain-containing protein/acyl carrier protein